MNLVNYNKLEAALNESDSFILCGRVNRASGVMVEAVLPETTVGTACDIELMDNMTVQAEVIGFKDRKALLVLFREAHGISEGCLVTPRMDSGIIPVGDELLGRVLDSSMNPVDDGPIPRLKDRGNIHGEPPQAMLRRRIEAPLPLGIRSIDSFLTVGEGQRIGVYAPSGVGKSSLIGMLAKNSKSEIVVVALVGERGREVKEFVDRDLGPDGLSRSVIIVATGDQSPLQRIRAAGSATAVAEYFRSKGKKVLLLVDSLSRVAMAQREIGLAAGEPPTSKGYPPSVYAAVPRLLERAGNDSGPGSITALYTVLTEGVDIVDPVVEMSQSCLDGHIVLSEKLARQGFFPAVDILRSVSRVMNDIVDSGHIELARKGRQVLSVYEEHEDLLGIGGYTPGTNPSLDYALSCIVKLKEFLRQDMNERASFEETVDALAHILEINSGAESRHV